MEAHARNSQAGIDLAEKLLVVNQIVYALGVLLLLGRTAGASEASYFVVRLNDIDQRHVITDSGATEVTNPDLRADEVLVQATDAQIQKLQSEPAVELIYAASDELARGVPVNACIRAEPLPIGELVERVGEGWTEGRKLSAHLTYSIGFVPTGLGRDRMTAAVQKALGEWSKYVQLDFTYQTQPDASRNLHFLFASKQHGDSYPFDGRGRRWLTRITRPV